MGNTCAPACAPRSSELAVACPEATEAATLATTTTIEHMEEYSELAIPPHLLLGISVAGIEECLERLDFPYESRAYMTVNTFDGAYERPAELDWVTKLYGPFTHCRCPRDSTSTQYDVAYVIRRWLTG